MTTLAVLAAMAGPPLATAPPWYGGAGRIVTGASVHLGIRPALYVDRYELAVGLTVQLSGRVL